MFRFDFRKGCQVMKAHHFCCFYFDVFILKLASSHQGQPAFSFKNWFHFNLIFTVSSCIALNCDVWSRTVVYTYVQYKQLGHHLGFAIVIADMLRHQFSGSSVVDSRTLFVQRKFSAHGVTLRVPIRWLRLKHFGTCIVRLWLWPSTRRKFLALFIQSDKSIEWMKKGNRNS